MVIWLIVFVPRNYIELAYSFSLAYTTTASVSIVILVLDILLSASAGLIGAESTHTLTKFMRFKTSMSVLHHMKTCQIAAGISISYIGLYTHTILKRTRNINIT